MNSFEGTVHKIVFEKPDSNFVIAQLSVPDRARPLSIVGPLLGIKKGLTIQVSGRLENHRTYGEQLRAEAYIPVEPHTTEEIQNYLASGVVAGIGKVMAERLTERFGSDTLRVIDEDPNRVTEVPGVGAMRKDKIVAAWRETKGFREIMLFLQKHDISLSLARRLYDRYGQRTATIVQHDPYRLAEDIRGVGFQSADKIAKTVGIGHDDPKRTRAAIMHALVQLSLDGHTAPRLTVVIDQTAALVGPRPGQMEVTLRQLEADKRLIIRGEAEESSVSLKELDDAEDRAASVLFALAGGPAVSAEADPSQTVQWIEKKRNLKLASAQVEAITSCLTSRLLVLTGGPGTGKTTVVQALIDVLERSGRRIALTAPTGRAAKRLAETTGRPASTIHRLLEYTPHTGRFKKGKEDPLEQDVVIVDETSMVDTVLFADLLDAIPPSAQLILVGDVDQLPSVGPGRVLCDVIDSGLCPVVRLKRIFRQTERSLIVQNAHHVLAGENLESSPTAEGDFFVAIRDQPDQILETVRSLVTTRIPKRFGLDPVRDIQVLTPMHRGVLGTVNINETLQRDLNPAGAELIRGDRAYRVGDKVLKTQNDHTKEVYNGDVGEILSVDAKAGTVRIGIDDREVNFERAELETLQLAYACSIHKSQGSEYPAVVLPLHTQHYVMLKRNLLYTAITRGRKLVVLVASRKAIEMALNSANVPVRHTGLLERLKAAIAQDGQSN